MLGKLLLALLLMLLLAQLYKLLLTSLLGLSLTVLLQLLRPAEVEPLLEVLPLLDLVRQLLQLPLFNSMECCSLSASYVNY